MNNYFNTKSIEQLNDRDILQNNFDKAFSEMDKNSLRLYYQNLRNLELDSETPIVCESVCLSSLVENITIACDIICADCNTNFIYCGNDTSLSKADTKLITKSVLNLLSNAFLYGKSELITVKTIEKSEFISIEIQSAGALPENFSFGKGLSFVENVCKSLNGHFFIETTLLSTRAVMLLPKSRDYKNIAQVPYFCDLLNDRLSPIYIEFFGIK